MIGAAHFPCAAHDEGEENDERKGIEQHRRGDALRAKQSAGGLAASINAHRRLFLSVSDEPIAVFCRGSQRSHLIDDGQR